jgi:hypothetical protein
MPALSLSLSVLSIARLLARLLARGDGYGIMETLGRGPADSGMAKQGSGRDGQRAREAYPRGCEMQLRYPFCCALVRLVGAAEVVNLGSWGPAADACVCVRPCGGLCMGE